MASGVLTCRELVELVTDYFEGALPADERSRFEEHVMSCPPCRTYLQQMRTTIELLGSIPEETVSPEAEPTLTAAFRDWKRG
jgi:anti-sigma factor RsiW